MKDHFKRYDYCLFRIILTLISDIVFVPHVFFFFFFSFHDAKFFIPFLRLRTVDLTEQLFID